jgi:hypothetical protein
VATHARITILTDDGTAIESEVATDSDPHPDLLDMLVARCVDLYRHSIIDEAEVEDGEG